MDFCIALITVGVIAGVIYPILLAKIFIIILELLFPRKRPEINNPKQAEIYYEHRKLMFLRWNWFLSMVILGSFSVIITYLIKVEELKVHVLLTIIGVEFFLCVLAFVAIYTRKAYCRMHGALENLLKYL